MRNHWNECRTAVCAVVSVLLLSVTVAVAPAPASARALVWGDQQNAHSVQLANQRCSSYRFVQRWAEREPADRHNNRIYGWVRLYRNRQGFCAANVASNRTAGRQRWRTVFIYLGRSTRPTTLDYGWYPHYAGPVYQPARANQVQVRVMASTGSRTINEHGIRVVLMGGANSLYRG